MVSTSSGAPGSGSIENDLDARSVVLHSDPRFSELKRRLWVFVLPMSIAFLAWYLLYVLMSAFARDIMGTVLFGPVNVALVFGLLQFASTFGIAIMYSRYAARRLDPLATELVTEVENPGKTTAGKDGGQA